MSSMNWAGRLGRERAANLFLIGVGLNNTLLLCGRGFLKPGMLGTETVGSLWREGNFTRRLSVPVCSLGQVMGQGGGVLKVNKESIDPEVENLSMWNVGKKFRLGTEV